MRTDELTEELRSQAHEVMTTGGVRMSELRVLRARRRRRRLTGGASALVLAAVVGVVMATGWGRTGDSEGADGVTSRPGGPTSPTVVPPPASAPWRTVSCNRPENGGCDVPAEVVYRGHRYVDSFGGLVLVHGPNGLNRSLGLSPNGSRLLLVGATGAGPGSRLTMAVGERSARVLPERRLTAWLVPHRHTGDVLVRETGRPRTGEVLRIEAYVLRR